MPTASRNERKKRRQRRNISLLTRELRSLNARHINAQFAILSALTGAGGEIIVSKDDVNKAMADFRFVNWTTERQDNGSMKISLKDNRVEVADPADDGEADPVVGARSVTAQLAQVADTDPDAVQLMKDAEAQTAKDTQIDAAVTA